jgi:heat shock protein 5
MVNVMVEMIPNESNNTTLLYVAFTDDERIIDDAAKNQITRNPRYTVFDAKRFIVRKFSYRSVLSISQ